MSASVIDPKIIDGKKISDSIIEQVKLDTEQLKKDTGIVPGLAVVLVVRTENSVHSVYFISCFHSAGTTH